MSASGLLRRRTPVAVAAVAAVGLAAVARHRAQQRVGGLGHLAQAARDFEAVDHRQADVQHDDLRRARDIEHFRLARQLRRTLVTLDRDYLDDRKFPPAEGSGVLVIAAIQGALGFFIFWVLGLPSPLLWGVVMAMLSLLPAVGAALVWADRRKAAASAA